jgi:diacylglycerol kinase family enzyme
VYDNIATKETMDIEGITVEGLKDGLTKRAIAYVNPKSGSGKGAKAVEIMKPIFAEAKVELIIRHTEYAGHITELANEEDLSQVNYLISIGGDGTLAELVNGFMTRKDHAEVKDKVSIGVIPAGTGNTVAYDLGILNDIDAAARRIVSNKGRLLDVVQCQPAAEGAEPVYSINIVGWALPASILKGYEAMRCIAFDCIRSSLYEVAGYAEVLANPVYRCKIEFPADADVKQEVRERLAQYQSYVYVQGQLTVHTGSRMPACPHAVLDDGLIDLVAIQHVSRLDFIKTADHLKAGTIDTLDWVDYVQCTEYTLTPEEGSHGASAVNIDGDLKGSAAMTVKCLPKCLLVSC